MDSHGVFNDFLYARMVTKGVVTSAKHYHGGKKFELQSCYNDH